MILAATNDNNPNPAYVVDGHESPDEDSMLAGDGQFPPFRIFHTPSQTYAPTYFTHRAPAQQLADWMNTHA